VHRTSLEVLVDGLIELGLLTGSREECLEKTAYTPYYMHNTSHWLGMDVHDAGSYRTNGASRALEPGMVLTVEPGLYVRADAGVDPALRGIGIRIEDDVLVTESGHEVLTSGVVKERADIEKIRTRVLS
jgi:Xaa-Pro aminopeptidase